MFKHLGIGLATAFTLISGNVSALPDRVGDFALLDTQGEFHQLSRYRNKEALVLMSYDASCASMNNAVAQLQSLTSDWQDEGFAFALIESSAMADIDAIRTAASASAVTLPLLVDDGQLVSETLQFSKAGEIVVLDPERLTVLYRGAMNAELPKALTAEMSGDIDATITTVASGCDLSFPVQQQQASMVPDYSSEVAPIVAEQCASCHREGGIGPFAMDSHLMLKGWSPMIREVLLTKRMPPTQVDPNVGHFTNARYMSDADLQTLVHWIDAGAPRGAGAADPLAELEFPDVKSWQLGEPDYIIDAPKIEVAATGVMDYIDMDVELPFDEDKWVKAVQFIPGDESVLHHLLAYVTAPSENFDGGEADTTSVARRFLEGYAPGKVDAMEFPAETGVYIPEGHKLSMQFHFTTNGKATSDETKIGLYMYDEPPKYENFTRSVASNFKIPAYAQDHEVAAQYVFQEDVVVTGLRAHMHFRGKDMKFTVETPSGEKRDLLSVPNYSYAWQPTYNLETPEYLPAGTKVEVTGAFDNSEYNPANPDPSKDITFGLQSWDEMFIGYWTYHAAEPSNP
jgi:peroxiredoxin